ncbi:MAG: hypothetical protein FWH20_05925 [Oscillospiraceae bacterium]|nr:hypothetical protein [Oscillospiraceae bacterium]
MPNYKKNKNKTNKQEKLNDFVNVKAPKDNMNQNINNLIEKQIPTGTNAKNQFK